MSIEEIEQAITQRMNLLATQDPQCQRWMGQLDVLRAQQEPQEPELEIHTDD